MNLYPCSGCGSRFCDGECFVEDAPDTQDTEELILRAESRLDYYSGHRSQFITNAETIVKKDDLRALIALARPRPDSPVTVSDAREEFLNLLADAIRFDEEPDGDDGTDCTRFHITTGWRQLADLAEVLGIKGPRYMETWKDALDRAIAEPAKLSQGSVDDE